MLITEKILGDIGGWQVMKAARGLLVANVVEKTERAGDDFRGLVREGKRKYAVTLTVQGPTKAECRCSCSEAQRGLVCAHAIAVALVSISSSRREEAQIIRPSANEIARSHHPAKKSEPPHVGCYEVPPGRFDVFIPAQRMESMIGEGGRVPVFLQFQSGGDEIDPVAQWLMQQDLPVQSGPLSLDVKTLGGFLNVLRDHPRVWEGRPGGAKNLRRQFTLVEDAVGMLVIRAEFAQPNSVTFSCDASHISRSGDWQSPPKTPSAQRENKIVGDDTPRTSNRDALRLQYEGDYQSPLLVAGGRWLFQRETLTLAPFSVTDSEVTKLIRDCLDKKSRGVVRDLRWLARNLDALENVMSLETDEALSHLRLVPAEPRFVIELDGSPRQATARVEVVVGSVRHPLSLPNQETSGEPYPILAADGTLTFYQRNTAREFRLRTELEAAGFAVSPDGGWPLKGEREVAEFFAVALPSWQRRHEVVFSERWLAAFRGWKRMAPMVRANERDRNVPPPVTGWLDMEFAYEAADGFRVPRHEVLRLIRSGQRTMRGAQGQTYALDSDSCDEFESLLSESGARLGEGPSTSSGRVELSADNGHILNEFLAVGQPISKLVLPDEVEVRRRLGDLASKLRDYQLEGVRWLIASAEAGRGALLADDMGLGKTVQVIALLRWLATCEQLLPRSALVICPTSLISNWNDELERFATELHVNIMHGEDRLIHKLSTNKYNVILTSYALLSKDLQQHNVSYYQAVILDEASHIRNPDTAVAKAVCSLNSPVRVALTGTPVENSVHDLWSLMRFVQPGFLGTQKDFAERYVKPLASAATDPGATGKTARRLRTRLGPFVLRRTKKEVVRELPDKIEKIIFCDLSTQQKEVYKRLLEEGWAEIRDARRRSARAGRMTMFTVLLRLRQVCNDLRLLGLNRGDGGPPPSSLIQAAKGGDAVSDAVEGDGATTSGKWEALADIVDDALGGAHKILIFSQFTGMLRLLRDWLDARSVGHSYLDGSTRDRGAQVAAFQTDPARRVFLISLKAGGYGLNLTAADHVILVEPWWNPAVEAQAIDRAHRIGQASVVTASRLIARGTVEERILKLQATKRQFMASAVEDDPLTLPGLTDDDLESLLE